MDSNDLTPEQAETLKRELFPALNFLLRLRNRMEKVGFTPADPLFQLVSKAYGATHSLSVDLHYRSCKSGVNRPSRPERKPDA